MLDKVRSYELRTIFSEMEQIRLLARKVLFCGEGTEEMASYVAGWMAMEGKDIIVLDGANCFNPYAVSFIARQAMISPERLLKKIRIARAFTCFQMATLMGEKLPRLLRQEKMTPLPRRPWVVLLGPITTFLDEDVSEREARPLFERSLRTLEKMAAGGVSLLLFQSGSFENLQVSSPGDSQGKTMLRRQPLRQSWRYDRSGRALANSRRTYFSKRLFQFSNTIWRIDGDHTEQKLILEKEIRVPLEALKKLE